VALAVCFVVMLFQAVEGAVFVGVFAVCFVVVCLRVL
jgi:hypothetical protein